MRRVGDEVSIRLRYSTGNIWVIARLVSFEDGCWLAAPIDTLTPGRPVDRVDQGCEGTKTVFFNGKPVYVIKPHDIGGRSRSRWP